MYEGDYYSNSNSPYAPAKRAPAIALRVVPTTGSAGVPTPVTLTWSIEYGVSASIDNGVGVVNPVNGSVVVPGILATTTWTLTVIALNGSSTPASATYTAS
jgi:hypothetical protein